ncbi:hypothetical protein [Bradyrhizobium sp. Ec3.3]|uniref:hypothetical protein n=1 Tax=Bradyrhizobium sp. Ec3.3 TaxID=189753 RepID=UPI000400AC40|nr:hypothetical protein [Bradyrhizobium sp. Ec3.3]
MDREKPRSCRDASKKQEQIVPTVTGRVYVHIGRMKEKRAVLDGDSGSGAFFF